MVQSRLSGLLDGRRGRSCPARQQDNGSTDAVSPPVRRDILPIPDPQHVGLTTYDAKDPDTTYPPITMLRPPEGAPNILIVLIDDVGFGASSAFGGPCAAPTAERLAAGGLKLNRFHTTALCSPTRQALLTGRNHHSVGMGGITEIATSAPGNSSIRPNAPGHAAGVTSPAPPDGPGIIVPEQSCRFPHRSRAQPLKVRARPTRRSYPEQSPEAS